MQGELWVYLDKAGEVDDGKSRSPSSSSSCSWLPAAAASSVHKFSFTFSTTSWCGPNQAHFSCFFWIFPPASREPLHRPRPTCVPAQSFPAFDGIPVHHHFFWGVAKPHRTHGVAADQLFAEVDNYVFHGEMALPWAIWAWSSTCSTSRVRLDGLGIGCIDGFKKLVGFFQ